MESKSDACGDNYGSSGCPDTRTREEIEKDQSESGHNRNGTMSGEENALNLETIEIRIHEMWWEKYNLIVLDKKDVFDFVYADPYQATSKDPPQYIDAPTRSAFIEFDRKVLVPGGFVFVIVQSDEAVEWISALRERKMLQTHLFYLIWDPRAVQRTKGHSLPVPVRVAVVSRKPGRHPKGFAVDVESPYTFLKDCSYS